MTLRNPITVNVAACDNQPLVLVFAKDAAARKELEARLAPLAWGDAFLGQFVYASTSDAKELADIEGAKPEAGVVVVQADKFGLKGTVLAQGAATATDDELVACLKEGAKRHQSEEKTFAGHVREGHGKGVFWQTVIPVTDPMELRARERGRNAGAKPE